MLRKELLQHFSTLSGFVFLAVFWAAAGIYFITAQLLPQNGDPKAFFTAFYPVLMFVLPILTMRLYAEERNIRTEELLLSSPLGITRIIMGKYASIMAVFGIAIAPTLAFPLILSMLGATGFSSAAGCYAGLVLMASAYITIGLFISVCTESQVAAAAATYAVFLFMYLAGTMGGSLGKWAGFFSLTARFEGFSFGIFRLFDVFYYLSVTALFLFLSVFVLEDRRLS
jgi:ABC-2 type transport system permease protein